MELLMEHKKEFNLLSKLTEDEIKEYSETSINNQEVKQLTITNMEDLLKLNITKKNVYDLLYIADYYEYDKIEEVIEKIRELIFNSGRIINKFKVNKLKLNNERLYNQIYNCKDCKDLEHANFKHLTCFKQKEKLYKKRIYCNCNKYEMNKICYCHLNVLIGEHNNLDVIKYVMENYKCKYGNTIKSDTMAIMLSCKYGHANITEYLIENLVGYDIFAIEHCIIWKHIECLKILDKYIDKYIMCEYWGHLKCYHGKYDDYLKFINNCRNKNIISDNFFKMISCKDLYITINL